MESVLHIGCFQGGSLNEGEAFFLSITLGILGGNGTEMLEIGFVANEHDDDVGIGVVPEFLEPPADIFKSGGLCDIIDKEGSEGTAIVGTGNGPVAFLSGSIPYLRFHSSSLNLANGSSGVDQHYHHSPPHVYCLETKQRKRKEENHPPGWMPTITIQMAKQNKYSVCGYTIMTIDYRRDEI